MIDDAQIRSWAAEHGFQLDADLTRDARVRELIQGELGDRARYSAGYGATREAMCST